MLGYETYLSLFVSYLILVFVIVSFVIFVVQAEQRSGRVGLAEYSVKNRDSLEILKRIEEQKKIISFVNDWKHFLEL